MFRISTKLFLFQWVALFVAVLGANPLKGLFMMRKQQPTNDQMHLTGSGSDCVDDSSLKNALKESESKLKDISSSRDNAQKRVATLEGQLSNCNSGAEVEVKKVQAAEKKLTEALASIKELENAKKTLEKGKENLEMKLKKLEAKLGALPSGAEDTTSKSAKSGDKNYNALKVKYDELQVRYDKREKFWEEDWQDAMERIELLEGEKEVAERAAKQAKEERKQAQREKMLAEQRAEEVEEKAEMVKEEYEKDQNASKKELDELKQVCRKEIEDTKAELKKVVTSVREEVNTAFEQVRELEASKEELVKSTRELREDLEEGKKHVDYWRKAFEKRAILNSTHALLSAHELLSAMNVAMEPRKREVKEYVDLVTAPYSEQAGQLYDRYLKPHVKQASGVVQPIYNTQIAPIIASVRSRIETTASSFFRAMSSEVEGVCLKSLSTLKSLKAGGTFPVPSLVIVFVQRSCSDPDNTLRWMFYVDLIIYCYLLRRSIYRMLVAFCRLLLGAIWLFPPMCLFCRATVLEANGGGKANGISRKNGNKAKEKAKKR